MPFGGEMKVDTMTQALLYLVAGAIFATAYVRGQITGRVISLFLSIHRNTKPERFRLIQGIFVVAAVLGFSAAVVMFGVAILEGRSS